MVLVPKKTIEALAQAIDEHNKTLVALLHVVKAIVMKD
jgi:hypothetical protein